MISIFLLSLRNDIGLSLFFVTKLHQYPGYDSAGLTPLPHGVKALEILAKVVDAQPRLRKTVSYTIRIADVYAYIIIDRHGNRQTDI